MAQYSWPATVHTTDKGVFLSFPDWPDIAPVGDNVQEAFLQAGELLSAAVVERLDAVVDVPPPSEYGPRQVPIAIDGNATARLEQWLKDRDAERFRQQSELEQIRRDQRAAFLTEFRANLEPVERQGDRADTGAREFALVGVRSCYFLNAGGLIAMPAILKLIPGDPMIDLSLTPTIVFTVGITTAAITNYLAYRSLFLAGQAHVHETNARAKEVADLYYPPKDKEARTKEITQERVDHTNKIRSASKLTDWGVAFFAASMICFLAGVCITTYRLSSIVSAAVGQ